MNVINSFAGEGLTTKLMVVLGMMVFLVEESRKREENVDKNDGNM